MFKKIVFFDELSDEAKEEARNWYREGNHMPFLGDDLREFLEGKLKDHGYTVEDLEIFYSLNCCQGDGVSFKATLSKGDKIFEAYKIDHYYQHENTMRVREIFQDGENEDSEALTEECRAIARETEKAGYDEIEQENSDEYIDDAIKANGYTFTLEGVRMDADINA